MPRRGLQQRTSSDQQNNGPRNRPAIVRKKDEADRATRLGPRGRISYFENKIIGKGYTAIVYEGYYEDPKFKAAVKRIQGKFANICYNEINILRKSGVHPNIVRYYASETWPESETQNTHYIAMELADRTLEDCVDPNSSAYVETSRNDIKTYLLEAATGLQRLHLKRILHRDIKPSNILIYVDSDSTVAKLADFGISREVNSLTVGSNSSAKGTLDWMSPEVLDAVNGRKTCIFTQGVDIFSLGLTMFSALSKSEHPFGDPIERLMNIKYNTPQWSRLPSHEITLKNLLFPMLSKNSAQRPNINCVLEHPFFWTDTKHLEFINDISNALNISIAGYYR